MSGGVLSPPDTFTEGRSVRQEELLAKIHTTYGHCYELIKKKNADYATSDDALKNINAASLIGITPAEAILVRVMDKITRISNLLRKDPLVTNESLTDSIVDAINYLAILKAIQDAQSQTDK